MIEVKDVRINKAATGGQSEGQSKMVLRQGAIFEEGPCRKTKPPRDSVAAIFLSGPIRSFQAL